MHTMNEEVPLFLFIKLFFYMFDFDASFRSTVRSGTPSAPPFSYIADFKQWITFLLKAENLVQWPLVIQLNLSIIIIIW